MIPWLYIFMILLTFSVLPRFEEQPRDREVVRGDLVILPCRVEAVPKPSVEWYKDGVMLNAGS